MLNLGEIEKWLKEHSINNYVISEDFYVSVQGNVNLNERLNGKKFLLSLIELKGILI